MQDVSERIEKVVVEIQSTKDQALSRISWLEGQLTVLREIQAEENLASQSHVSTERNSE